MNISTFAATRGSQNIINDDPFSIELERLDVFDVANVGVEQNSFMNDVLDEKKSLLDDGKLMRKLMRLDEFTADVEVKVIPKTKVKKQQRKTKVVRRHNVDDDDEELMEEVTENANPGPNEDEGRADEEATDEEIPVDELEEVNHNLVSFFVSISQF